MAEEPLPGNMTSGVVRVGDTVRRPVGPWTPAVDALLQHLHDHGFDRAPRPLGRDRQGRQVLEFMPGEELRECSPADLHELGRLLRDLHRTAAGFVPEPGARWQQLIPPDRVEMVVHNDPGRWNLVRGPAGFALIDWDLAGPGSRLWDLSHLAVTCVPLEAGRPVTEAMTGLRHVVDGYDLPDARRSELAGMLARRTAAMVAMLRREAGAGHAPWDRIWRTDGGYWTAGTQYLTAHLRDWTRALLD